MVGAVGLWTMLLLLLYAGARAVAVTSMKKMHVFDRLPILLMKSLLLLPRYLLLVARSSFNQNNVRTDPRKSWLGEAFLAFLLKF